jgi:hypothetical protein
MGSDFTQTYSGAGTTTTGITNGAVTTQPVLGSPRTCVYIYNALQFTTDYQKVGQTFTSAPNLQIGGNNAQNTIIARSNSAGTSYVFAEFEKNTARLGCVVSGSRTVWTTLSSGFSFKAGQTYWLVCGTTGGLRSYQVLEGSVPIISWTEVGTSSQLGASYRYPGGGTYVYSAGAAVITAGSFSSFTFADNTPATTLGSFARVYRANTNASGAAGTGDQKFATFTFDATDRITQDIIYDATNNKFSVSKVGTYVFEFGWHNPNTLVSSQSVEMLCWKGNGAGSASVYERDGRYWDQIAWKRMRASFTLYLVAGDYVQPGCNFATNSPTFIGDAAGTLTFMTLAKVQ